MKAYICGSSALYYWRRDPRADLTLKDPCKSCLSDSPKFSSDFDLLHLSLYDFGPEPFRLMVQSKNNRLCRGRYSYSVWSESIPKSFFYHYNSSICVASPELCLLQAAERLSRFQLMELCMEVLGYYALVPNTSRGFLSRNYALTTIKSLKKFINSVSDRRGREKLAFAVKFVEEGSRSPMETRVFLMSTLLKRLGGFGLPAPNVNARIELTSTEQRKTKRSYLECDLLWEKEKIVIEFDGYQDHESRVDRARDAIKRETLTAKGYKVFTITGAQVLDEYVFGSVIKDIAREIGHRLKCFPSNWDLRHSMLREELFKSMTFESSDFIF